MADKKIEKALYGPSLTEVALGAVLGLLCGVIAACVYLVFKPVMLVREMPKEKIRGMVYFIPGSDSSSKGRPYNAKQKQFVAGSSITLIEDELNAWAASTFAEPKNAATKPGAKPDDKAVTNTAIFNPGRPNFRILDGQLQISFKCVLNWYGLTHEVTVVTIGAFEKSGDKFIYAPRTVYLGSCPVHLLPAAAGPLVSTLSEKQKGSDELRSAWAKLSDVTIEGNTLKLTVQ